MASAWVGTPKPGTSMPTMRTPLICLGSICSGTPRRGGNAEAGDDDGVVGLRIGHFVDGVADVLVELAGDQGFRIERDVADRALGAVEMRGEGQTVHAAGRARQDGADPAHAKPDAKRAKGGAHRLRLVMRALGVIRLQLRHYLGLARSHGLRLHFLRARCAGHAFGGGAVGRRRGELFASGGKIIHGHTVS